MSVRKRGNSYQVIYRCSGEKSPRTETFKTEDEALIRDMQIKLAKKNGNFIAPVRTQKGKIKEYHQITVKELLDEFVEVYGLKMWGNSYYDANISLIRNYINPYIGERYVNSISVKDIDTYYSMLLEQPAVVKKGHKNTDAKITANTIARIHKLLKSAFGRAVFWEYTEINPTLGATLPKENLKAREVWSDSEALEAIKLCENPTLRICLYLALGCSMRLGEILGLQWFNVHMDCDEPYVNIDRELQRCSNKSIEALERVNRSTIITKFPVIMPKKATTTLVLKAPKTASSVRTVYLPQAVIDELEKCKLKQEENKSLLSNEYHDYGLVVAKVNGLPYEMRSIDRMLNNFIKQFSLRPVVFHSLRHSSTSLKLKLSKGNIKAVQGDTGHAEARMVTDTYAHGFDEDRKLIAKEMDNVFFSKIDAKKEEDNVDADTLDKLKKLLKQNPGLLDELLK